MKCLDTTFLIDFLKNDKGAIAKADEIKYENLATTTPNIFEALFGIYRKKQTSMSELDSLKKILGNLDILNFDLDSSFLASKITADLINSGKEINAMDCLVAGTMLSKNCNIIVTRDAQHFKRIKGVEVESY